MPYIPSSEYECFCVTECEKLNRATQSDTNYKEPLSTSHLDAPTSEGKQIGSYINAIHHQDGLFSTVYKAKDSNGRLVALKYTTPSHMTAPHNSMREARILKKAAHDHIIKLLSTFQQAGGHFILVFPFLPLDLATILQNRTLSSNDVHSHLRDIFIALAHLHSLGIIHRDVKPSNILLASPSGPAYLADFGIAWMQGDEASEPAERKIIDVGTTSYRPPELLFGHTGYDSSLDLWAAGCVVAEMVTGDGKPLFDSGPLGSELALIQSIFKTLGTPNLEIWPVHPQMSLLKQWDADGLPQESADFPDWGKMSFYKFPAKPWVELLPDVPDEARDLITKLVRYQSTSRLRADEVLYHPFLR